MDQHYQNSSMLNAMLGVSEQEAHKATAQYFDLVVKHTFEELEGSRNISVARGTISAIAQNKELCASSLMQEHKPSVSVRLV